MSATWGITGANGFIGRNLAAHLERRGISVRKFDARLADRDALRALVRGAGVIVHLAAHVHKRAQTEDERRACRETNVEGTRNVVEAIAAEAPGAFLIFVSSANVYPDSDAPLDESAAPAPKSLYGATKLEAERIVLGGGIHATAVRPAMVFGGGAPGNLGRLVSMIRRRVVPLFGGGKNRKSLLPVAMLCDAIAAIGERRLFDGEVVNVAGAALPMRRIVDVLAEARGVRPLRVPLPAAPVRFVARIVDAIAVALHVRLPKIAQIVDTYASSSVLSDAKLRREIAMGGVGEVEAALKHV